MARQARHIYVARGKKVIHIDMSTDSSDDETLKRLLLGPTGNLRAPTLRKGKTLLVGFDADTYAKVLG